MARVFPIFADLKPRATSILSRLTIPRPRLRASSSWSKHRIPRRFGLDPIRDVQVLCPMNRGGVGARSLNIELHVMALLRDYHAGGADTSPITVRTQNWGVATKWTSLTVFRQRAVDRHPFGAPDEPHSGLVVPGLPAERAVCRTRPPRGQKRSRRARSANDWFRRVLVIRNHSLQTRTACTPCADTRRQRSAGWVAVLAALPLPAMSSQTVSAR